MFFPWCIRVVFPYRDWSSSWDFWVYSFLIRNVFLRLLSRWGGRWTWSRRCRVPWFYPQAWSIIFECALHTICCFRSVLSWVIRSPAQDYGWPTRADLIWWLLFPAVVRHLLWSFQVHTSFLQVLCSVVRSTGWAIHFAWLGPQLVARALQSYEVWFGVKRSHQVDGDFKTRIEEHSWGWVLPRWAHVLGEEENDGSNERESL